MLQLHRALIGCVLAALLLGGCAYRDAKLWSNGLDGQLFASTDEGRSPSNVVFEVGASTSVCVDRRYRVKTGNGLGDSSEHTEFDAWRASDAQSAKIEVTPSLGAVTGRAVEGNCLMFDVAGQARGDATLSVEVGSLSDRWAVSFE
jgi:hypothetical protein